MVERIDKLKVPLYKNLIPGSYDWVASFDATSLYPSIIMQYNMSPETIVPGFNYDVSGGRST